ncbi:LytR/AlgR family response regulator transcription factor [Oceanobacillus picturae]|uniref:LytR/AlgR family response regulator transcription factor n=1 Tax=Oceanobacillus picturae TaxID=171693 RepID=UPI000E6A67C0|nr:LytTR family DNA-binding domain-containing protein [Oceanobacillus picturae]RIU91170.1 DNA-binding response regulator [Oceanobacillus picturae]
MKQIDVLVVDDERYAREELVHLLGDFKHIRVVGEAESGEDAIVKSLTLKPDIVFLDIEMPKMNGMEAAKVLQELKKAPLIIFATAYPQFAADAFRLEALDYLLKPYEEDQLQETISRVRKRFSSVDEQTIVAKGKLSIETEGEIHYLNPADILYLSREDKFTKIFTADKEYHVRATLKDLESRLAGFEFFRIHKSYVVNLSYVKMLTPWFNGAYQLKLEGKEEALAVSRNYVKALRSKLEL